MSWERERVKSKNNIFFFESGIDKNELLLVACNI